MRKHKLSPTKKKKQLYEYFKRQTSEITQWEDRTCYERKISGEELSSNNSTKQRHEDQLYLSEN